MPEQHRPGTPPDPHGARGGVPPPGKDRHHLHTLPPEPLRPPHRPQYLGSPPRVCAPRSTKAATGRAVQIRRSGFEGRVRTCHAVSTGQYRAVNGHLQVRFEKANLHIYCYRPTSFNFETCVIAASSTKCLAAFSESAQDAP